MKLKRYKHARRIVSFYKNTFGLHEPYQVLVDGTFCQAALKGKIQIREQLPKYLGGPIQLVTTRCVIAELVALGPQLSGAVFIAKRFQLRVCGHKKNKSATDCITSLVGENNPHRYFVASQDMALQKILRAIPGTPLLHIVRNTMVLEGPSDTSHKKAEEVSLAKVQPTSYEKSVLQQLDAAAAGASDEPKKKGHRKRPKGPNPLAVKKSTKPKRSVNKSDHSAGTSSRSQKRRMRSQRSKVMALLNQIQAQTETRGAQTQTRNAQS